MCCGGHAYPAHGHNPNPHSHLVGWSCDCSLPEHHGHSYHSHHHPVHRTHGHHSHHGGCCCCKCGCEEETGECEGYEDWEEMDKEEALTRLEDYFLELKDELEMIEKHLESLKQ